jgi:P2 family phage contractile tail tube protein
MATASDILKNFNLFIDGKGYAGVIDELELPKIELKYEDFRAGGMDAPIKIEMGQEAMECSITLSGHNEEALILWGVEPGNLIPLVARGALESFGKSAVPVVVNMSGRVRGIEYGNWKAGEKSTIKLTIDVFTYKYTQNNKVLHEIDVLNMIRIINGKDRLAEQRAALGI